MVIPMFAALQAIFQILLAIVAIFLILLVLVQRGRGGGLAGALGGMGGSSAFGAKAGDIFTRITIIAAAVWIFLCIAAAKLGPASAGSRLNVGGNVPASTETSETGPAIKVPAEGEDKKTDAAAESKPAADTSQPAVTESKPAEQTPAAGEAAASAPAASGDKAE